MGIPKNAPKDIINQISEDTEAVTLNMTILNDEKIEKRFQLKYALNKEDM